MNSTTYEMVRSGSLGETTIQDIGQHARGFFSSAPAGTTLTLMRDEDSTMRAYLTLPLAEGETTALAKRFAETVRARPVLVAEGLSLAETRHISRIRVRDNSSSGNSQMQGTSPTNLVEVLDNSLAAGEWVSISSRRPTRAEERGNFEVQSYRGTRQHQSLQKGAVVVSMYAGSTSSNRAKENIRSLISAFPGVDVRTRAVTPVPAPVHALVTLGIALALGTIWAFFAPISTALEAALVSVVTEPISPSLATPFLVGAILFLLLAIGQAFGKLPTHASKRMKGLGMGLVPIAPRKWVQGKKPRASSESQAGEDGVVRVVAASDGDYPLRPAGMLLDPAVATMIAMPHGSAFASGTTAERKAPALLRQPVGPTIGDDTRSAVRINIGDMWAGIFIAGLPGSGKSYLLEAIWGWWVMVLNRDAGLVPISLAKLWQKPAPITEFEFEEPEVETPVTRRKLPGADATEGVFTEAVFEEPITQVWPIPAGLQSVAAHAVAITRRARAAIPGLPKQSTLIAFDTKGDGVATASYQEWCRKFGIEPLTINISEVGEDFGIEMFPMPPQAFSPHALVTPEGYANDVVDALAYAFGDDAIGPRSRPSLIAAFTAGSLIAGRQHLLPATLAQFAGESAWTYANILVGNHADEVGVELAGAIFEAAAAPGADPWMLDAAGKLGPIYGANKTANNRAQLFDAPRTKVLPMMQMRSWWSRPAQATWDEILDTGRPVILNFGVAPSGRMLGDKIREQFGAFVLYSLRKAIERHCAGWQKVGKAVVLFADEVKHLASDTNDAVLTWFRSDGRSFGVFAVFATQFPEQLAEAVRATMLGYATQIMFRQSNKNIREQVASNISGGGGEWTGDDIDNLAIYTPVIKTTVKQESVPGFTAKVYDFAAMSAEQFAEVQLSDMTEAA